MMESFGIAEIAESKEFSSQEITEIPEDMFGLPDESVETRENQSLTAEDREKMQEESGWSDVVVDKIDSKEEYTIYKDAGLKEEEINGKECLVRDDIDMEQKDEFGRTNKERMEQGLAPIAQNGETIELHHIGQKPDSPLAELTGSEHRGHGNDTVLHEKTKESEIDRAEFKREKEEHWETRAGQA